MRVPGFSFGAPLHSSSSTCVYAGTRDSDGVEVIAKLSLGGGRNLSYEYLLLQKAAGPGVPEAITLCDSSDGPALIQRRFGTANLAAAVRHGPLGIRPTLRIAIQLTRICERIHRARILHRDIKPANILHDGASETIELGDFGIAAELPIDTRALPAADLVGTPRYMSPEHTGRTSVGCDVRSDLYSIGVTLYELLTGVVPFPDGELIDLVAAHLSRIPEPPHRRNPAIPPVLGEVVMKLLAKSPDQRYQSAGGLTADLARCLETLTPDGQIPAFDLGGSDLIRPRFPERIFGRSAELQVLEQALARAATGAPTLVLISGREGSGRSELVRELIRSAAAGSPLALGGWSMGGAPPLAGLGEALTQLTRDLLLLEEDQLARLRQQFAARVGQVGQVVLDVVPALGDVFGAQPGLPELDPGGARARVQHGFRCLAGALGEAAPFVLALRGFEHADPATVSLIQGILSSDASCRALVVAMAADPAGFGRLREHPGAVAIELAPLACDAMTDWAAATLGCDGERIAELGEALHTRSAGNPLMFVRLLEHLVDTGVIAREGGAYTWSLDAVSAASPPPTLGALAAQRIAELDVTAQRVLAALAAADEPVAADVLAAMLAVEPTVAQLRVVALAAEGLVVAAAGGHRPAHPVIATTALATVAAEDVSRMYGRLGAHLLAASSATPTGPAALRIALALSRGTVDLASADRIRAAEALVIAAEHLIATIAYELAVALFTAAAAYLDDTTREDQRALQFRIDLGTARCLTMLGRYSEAGARFEALALRDLRPAEIGLVYPSWCDHHSSLVDRASAIAVGLAGLARLGIRVPAEPPKLRPFAAIRLNQRRLSRLTPEDHLRRPEATDPTKIAAVKILSTLLPPALFAGRQGLFFLIAETALGLVLQHGHQPYLASLLALHANALHGLLGRYADARHVCEAAIALDDARPAGQLRARTAVNIHYLASPWFLTWKDAGTRLARGIRLGVEEGDPVFASLCASSSITMLNMVGTPLDRVVSTVESWKPYLPGDGAVAVNAANVVYIAGKISRGEPLAPEDLDRVTNVPLVAGSMRHNAMVNLGLAVVLAGHERQVRAWLDEIRDRFPITNCGQPHQVTLWWLDGLFAAKDARIGTPARRRDAERWLDILRTVRRDTRATNTDPMIALLEAELAWADGDIDRAVGLFSRAVRDARAQALTPLVAFALEERAWMLSDIGDPEEVMMYFRAAVVAYRRWGHLIKVAELERAYPELRPLGPSATTMVSGEGGTLTTTSAASRTGTLRVLSAGGTIVGQTVHDQLDLVTVLKVSHDISAQLTGSGVVRSVLTGIARNAGAERVVFVLRASTGVETVHGELHGGQYRDLDVSLQHYAGLPRSVLRVVRRTGRPLVVGDAASDPGYASDPFVVEQRCRSIAAIPVHRKGEVAGLVVLENRMVASAFTPQLIRLVQALVAQAALSLDNASLYKNLEDRVADRTAALNARNAELRLVLDHVAEGLVMVGRDGRLFAERSAILGTWFPEGMPEALIGLFADDDGAAAWFDLVWEQLVNGFLPLDLALGQLPRQLRRGDRILAIDWQPILGEGGGIERMLVVLSDVTEAARRVEAEREQKQLTAVLEALSEDRNGVVELLKDASAIVVELAAGRITAEVEKRLIHTLKGNTALFGLSALSARCHDIEDAMELDARRMTDDERRGLAAAWHALRDKLARVIDIADGVVQVQRADYDAVLTVLRRDGHPAAHDVELWALEPLRVRFQRIAEQARALAERLGKGPVQIQIEHGRLYLETEVWAPFWSAFVHVVRNAVDHGVETADERARLGKGIATLTLRGQVLAGRTGALVLEMSDDGRGISWDGLRDKARKAGLPAESRADLIAAMFHDGISTRANADEISGRGVGLGALAAVCRTMGCEISVDSAAGRGTTLRFELPAHFAKVRRGRSASLELVPMTPPP